ncbi:MAG TPA: RluA family pseudouridine synthase [Candidatus Saccharimonadales bacterium]|nr:RluA family pseudouridine synthase [Candidatus Saccharimonadales bacterium]
MNIDITSSDTKERLDSVIQRHVPRLSRSFVKRLCDEDKVLVDGKTAKAGYRLREGDRVTLQYNLAELDSIPSIELPIIYEDDDCVVINKPVGVLTHAVNEYNLEATVASFLRDRIKGLTGERAGVVHRLDRATSGVIIGAKTPRALSFLQKQFSQRKVKKTYIAVVKGHLRPPEAVIDMPIGRNPKAPSTFRVDPNGKPAVTHYKVLRSGTHNDLVELRPETGRTHQLRVHLDQCGHPILGDQLYGRETNSERLFLHAQQLEITLPNKERKVFTAPTPDEFEEQL